MRVKEEKEKNIVHTVVGFLMIVIGVILMPVPIIPGFVFVIFGASLMGYKIGSLLRWKKRFRDKK